MAMSSLKFPPEKLCECFKYHPLLEGSPKPNTSNLVSSVPLRLDDLRLSFCKDVPKGYKNYQAVEKGEPGLVQRCPFRTALDYAGEPLNDFDHYTAAWAPITAHNIVLNRIGERIRDKSNWWIKIEDDELWSKWMDEAAMAPAFALIRHAGGFNDKARVAIREELRWLAMQREKKGFDLALDYTVKSDVLIPSELKQQLLTGVAKLEDIPEEQKDWHPKSKNRVLDLVHPSLYPIMYGTTRIMDDPIEFDPATVIGSYSMKGRTLGTFSKEKYSSTASASRFGFSADEFEFGKDDEVDSVIRNWYTEEKRAADYSYGEIAMPPKTGDLIANDRDGEEEEPEKDDAMEIDEGEKASEEEDGYKTLDEYLAAQAAAEAAMAEFERIEDERDADFCEDSSLVQSESGSSDESGDEMEEEDEGVEESEGEILDVEVPPMVTSASSSTSGHIEPDEPVEHSTYQDMVYSDKYCWLPTDFHIEKDTGEVTHAGYINNLHPSLHASLYSTISKILEKCVPLFNEVLTQTISPPRDRTSLDCYNLWKNVSLKEFRKAPMEIRNLNSADYEGYENSMDYEERVLREIEDYVGYTRRYRTEQTEKELRDEAERECLKLFKLPECRDFRPPLVSQYSKVDLSKHHRIQIIVKLANIVLTPDQPKYDGGSWHVEGAMNERIVASAIYYYDCDNVTENELAFRRKCEIPGYEQNDEKGVELAYGLKGKTGLVQDLGSIITKEDRVIVFPNTFQHRVSPLRLVDPTKPGHRKILCFFLVDPFNPIPSTSNIGPQQGDWWDKECGVVGNLSERVPPEIFQHIFSYIKEPLSMDEAKEVRLDLMAERGISNHAVSANHLRDFTLCEH